MPHADLDGLRLYYQRAGSGEPELLFVPGWCCDHTAFQPQFDHFARTHAVTSLDLRGVGQSDSPGDGYSIPELADDVAAFCDAVGIEKPVRGQKERRSAAPTSARWARATRSSRAGSSITCARLGSRWRPR